MDNFNLSEVQKYVSNIEDEIIALKTTMETMTEQQESFVPMTIFYNSPDNKILVVAPNSSGTPVDRIRSVAEVMHLFNPLDASAAVVCLHSKIERNENIYPCLNLFVLTEPYAWTIQLPYTLDNNKITWLDDYRVCAEIDTVDMDESGKDIATMFYYLTHISTPFFSAGEVLSYISSTGGAISQVNSNIEYFDFSQEELVT